MCKDKLPLVQPLGFTSCAAHSSAYLAAVGLPKSSTTFALLKQMWVLMLLILHANVLQRKAAYRYPMPKQH